jgi:hypothetical protein
MSDWTAQTADRIERTVASVRERTVRPAETASRAVVFGLLAGFFALTAVVLLCVLVFRLLCIAMPVWAAWLVLGGIFVVGGGLCWAFRTRPAETPADA